jgi:hypothetical protein
MILYTLMPLFTGPAPKEEMSRRQDALYDWLQTTGYEELKAACGERVSTTAYYRTSITAYYPGKALYIPSKDDPDAMEVVFPPNLEAKVPKGLVVRLHLLYLLYQLEHPGGEQAEAIDPSDVVFSCIDGSGAFDFDSLKLIVETFNHDPNVDVVLGRRPSDYSGMIRGRKEIEEFEQYLLFQHCPGNLSASFSDCDLSTGLLPDGQAGCWGFRMRCAQHLPLTANGYEIEYDLLASALEARLKIAYTPPLLMPRKDRHSGASTEAIKMSIRKLEFIRRKLCISRGDIVQAWRDFASRFAGTPVMDNIPQGYAEELFRAYIDK